LLFSELNHISYCQQLSFSVLWHFVWSPSEERPKVCNGQKEPSQAQQLTWHHHTKTNTSFKLVDLAKT